MVAMAMPHFAWKIHKLLKFPDYTRCQIKSDQLGSHDFRRFLRQF